MTKKREHAYQLTDGAWYQVAHGKPPYQHECCHCSLVHTVEYKIENGRIWERWTIDEKATESARRKKE